jgi:hypothetical protein
LVASVIGEENNRALLKGRFIIPQQDRNRRAVTTHSLHKRALPPRPLRRFNQLGQLSYVQGDPSRLIGPWRPIAGSVHPHNRRRSMPARCGRAPQSKHLIPRRTGGRRFVIADFSSPRRTPYKVQELLMMAAAKDICPSKRDRYSYADAITLCECDRTALTFDCRF